MFFWATLEKNIPFLVNFAFTIVLARHVAPDAYGLVAMTAILTALGNVIQNMGLTSALIQRKELRESDTTTVFLANIVLSGILAVLLVVSSGGIARFFGRDEIVIVVYVNAAALLFAAFGAVQMAMLQRHFRFRAGLVIETAVSILAGTCAIVTVFLGQDDLWALLVMILVREGSRALLLWLLIQWRPRGGFSAASLRELWSYGRHMVGASFYHHCATNLASVMLGKLYSATTLGLYGRAQSLQMLPVGLVTQPVQRVAFPMYSQSQYDLESLRALLRGHVRSVALLAGVITAVLATCAREIVLILLGDVWADSIPMLQTLAFAAFFNIVFPLHSEANKAIGESRWFFWIELTKKTVLVALVATGGYLGVSLLLWALVAASVIDYGLSAISSVRFLGYTWRMQFDDLGPALGLTTLAIFGAVLTASVFTGPMGLFTELSVKVGGGCLVFGLGFYMFGAKAFPEVNRYLLVAKTFNLRRFVRV